MPKPPKRQDIELLRILSALAVVWFHSQAAGGRFMYAGLIVFLVISVFLFAQAPAARPAPLAARARRLLQPWLFWFGFYALFNGLTGRALIPLDGGLVAGMLAGPSIHLWYLPFVFFVFAVLGPLTARIPRPHIAWASALLLVLLFAASPMWRAWSMQLARPYPQYIHSLGGVLAGLFFANFREIPALTRWSLLAAVLLSVAASLPVEGVGLPYLIGLVACAAVLLSTRSLLPEIELYGLPECTLGIYLLHPFLIGFALKFHLLSGIALPLGVFATSAALIWLYRRNTPTVGLRAV